MRTTFTVFGSSPTKENIIELLSEEWPLTARKIYKRLTKNYHLSITYQAAHKALKELTENKILEKRKDGYLISKDWVKQLGDFTEKLTSELENIGQKREVKTIHKLIFKTHREFIKFHLNFMQEVFMKEKKLEMVFHYRHVPYPHVMSNEEIKGLKKLMKKMKWTILVRKDTPVGRWCAKQWKKFGVKVRLGVDIAADRMIIMNDYIINVYMSKEALLKWDDSYAVKNIANYDVNLMNESILNPKYKTIATIVKDKELANLLRSNN